MAMSAEQKATIVADHQQGAGDTGSPEVQVALLSHQIGHLTNISKNTSMIITRVAGC